MEYNLSKSTSSSDGTVWCHHPFRSLQTNGVYGVPCCNFRSTRYIPLENYFNSDDIIDVRQKILNGVIPSQCSQCVQSEKNTGSSYRTHANNFIFDNNKQEYDVRGDTDLEHIFLVGDNVCNLKCLPCYHSSFVRSTELFNLKLLHYWPVAQEINLDHLLTQRAKKITITGGEPFYSKKIIEFLKKYPLRVDSTDVELDINTNLTTVNIELIDFLVKTYKKVQIKGSVDGVGRTNDYLRYPSQFAEIESGIDIILSYPEIEFCLTTALSNLALLHFDELLEWGVGKGIRNHYISIVNDVNELAVYHLPRVLKQSLLDKFINLKNSIDCQYHNRTAETLETCINICNNNIDYNVSPLIEYLNKHDNLRGTDFLTVFPELADYGDK